MIKLIASDMDGTLLNDEKRLPDNFFDILKKLKDRNIEFVVCSGRSYVTLELDFKEIMNETVFICDNGAYIADHGKNIYTNVIDRNLWLELIEKSSEIKGIRIIVCGIDGTYYLPDDSEYEKIVKLYYPNSRKVNDFSEINDSIFKVSICDITDPRENSYNILRSYFKNRLSMQISGPFYLDIMNKGVDKGTAFEKIQKNIGASYEETMVFGDFYNDISLLSKAKYSFVMENANEDMKKYGNFIAENNNKCGVIKAIEKYVLK